MIADNYLIRNMDAQHNVSMATPKMVMEIVKNALLIPLPVILYLTAYAVVAIYLPPYRNALDAIPLTNTIKLGNNVSLKLQTPQMIRKVLIAQHSREINTTQIVI